MSKPETVLNVKPMLAATLKADTVIPFPVAASPKIDGIRALVVNGVLVSRTLKPIRNRFIQSFPWAYYEGLDGELVVGSETDPNCMQNTSSGVMSADGEPDWKYMVFDNWDTPELTYFSRLLRLQKIVAENAAPEKIHLLNQFQMENRDQLDRMEERMLSTGFEGIMIRNPLGTYKFGRSTIKEFGLVKVKRFEDAEATVIGFIELMHNVNELGKDALGLAKRSGAKDGMIPGGTLGSLLVRDSNGAEFGLGSGFNAAQRAMIWEQRSQLVGSIVKFKHFAICGVKDAPRTPIFLGFRDNDDIVEN